MPPFWVWAWVKVAHSNAKHVREKSFNFIMTEIW